jgi:tetratricopeptide (TPR) repeat protein
MDAYAQLIREMDLIRSLIPDHIYLAPCMKYADLMFLKGRFDEALALVHKLLAENTLTVGDQIELLRIKGHIYRFQQQYADAELIYRSALRVAEKSNMKAYTGKLYTNLAEATCVRKPAEALEWYEKAREANTAAENAIELGKAYAAASTAYTALGQIEDAVSCGDMAVQEAEKSGYLSGQAFGLAVLCYAYRKAGDAEKANEALERLRAIIGKIGVYRYVLERFES